MMAAIIALYEGNDTRVRICRVETPSQGEIEVSKRDRFSSFKHSTYPPPLLEMNRRAVAPKCLGSDTKFTISQLH